MYLEHLLVLSTCFILSITGSALHGPCTSNDDCGTIDTHCKNHTCVCRENFDVWYDSCVQLVTPLTTCVKRHDCHGLRGVRSICTKNSLCACKPFHHIHLGQCVKNRDLHDMCEHDHQCYCGAGCEDKIACIDKNCTCKPGHKPYRIRRCIHDPDFPVTLLSFATRSNHKSVTPAPALPIAPISCASWFSPAAATLSLFIILLKLS